MVSSALLTDLYQLTMANGYYKTGLHDKQSCFQQFFRRAPFGSRYVIAAGLQSALEFIQNFHFSDTDLAYLSSLMTANGSPLFDKAFITYLSELKLSVEVDAVLEGTLVFALEPMLRVRGPILQCQLLETALLNIVNFQSLIATKASRCVAAAAGREVIDFGLRRAQGPDGGVSASRAAFIGGCLSTSNVLAGKQFGIPVKGTQAHSWIMAFGDEKKAFKAFADAMPDNVVLLVDTYHTVSGLKNAIEVGVDLRSKGHMLRGIRLDSGNLEELSKIARSMLNAAGLFETQILVSGDLDEYRIASLAEADAPIDAFGVGTRMITAFDEPALGGVYKLAAIEDASGRLTPCLKVSDDEEKTTLPGLLQTRRFIRDGRFVGDLIFDEQSDKNPQFQRSEVDNTTSNDLLVEVYRSGARTLKLPPLRDAQERARHSLRALEQPSQYPVWIHPKLTDMQTRLIRQVLA